MRDRIDYLWRLVGTGLSFTLFGLGGILLGIAVFPVIHILAENRGKAQRLCRRIVHWTFLLFIEFMHRWGVLDYRFEGADLLRMRRGLLVIANHPSLIDIVFLISRIPDALCVVKSAAWRNPFMVLVVRATGYISNSDPNDLIKICSKVLSADENLVLFPEGTRTRRGKKMRFLRGAALIAVNAGKNFTPVHIYVTPPTLQKGIPWYRIPSKRPFFSLSVGEDIDPSLLIGETSDRRRQAKRLNQLLISHFEEQGRKIDGSKASQQAA